MRITKQVVVWDDFDRADGIPVSTPWGLTWKQSSTNFTISSNALVKSTGSGTLRYFTLVSGQAANITIDAKIRTCPTTNTTDLGFALRSLDSTATRGGQLYFSIRKTAAANSIRLLHRVDTSGTDTVLAQNTTAGWADNTDYAIKIVSDGLNVEIFVDGVSKLAHTLSTGVNSALTGTDIGITFTNTDVGSKIYDIYVIDPALQTVPVATSTKIISHRGTIASAPDITEEQPSGLSILPRINGPEVDARRTSNGDFYLCHDTTFDRTSPTGATGSSVNVSTANWIAAGMTELSYYLDICDKFQYKDIFVQAIIEVQSEMNGLIAKLNSHPAKDRIVVMTSVTGGETHHMDQIRIAGWTGQLGCYGLTTTNWAAGLSADFATYNAQIGFLESGDSGYDAQKSMIATLHAAGYKAGASTITPARFVNAVTDGVDYILTDYVSEFVLWYKSPTETVPSTAIPTNGQVWPRSRTTILEEGMLRTVTTISSNTTLAATAKTEYTYICSAGLIATLPTAVGNKNLYSIKRSGTSDVMINTTASQTIDGASSYTLDTQWQSVDLLSDNSNWVII